MQARKQQGETHHSKGLWWRHGPEQQRQVTVTRGVYRQGARVGLDPDGDGHMTGTELDQREKA